MNFLAMLAAELWAMEPRHLQGFFESLGRLPVASEPVVRRGDDDEGDVDGDLYSVDQDGTAHLSISGPMLKRAPAWLKYYGIAAADMTALRAAVVAADADPQVKRIRLSIDTPGGQVSGTDELAQAVRDARKPVHAHVEGMMASAGTWVGTAADFVSASPLSQVGSIGVYAVAYDWSKAIEEAGIKAHLISSGGVKGQGSVGVPISADALKAWQANIDAIAGKFIDAVAGQRRMDRADLAKLATGHTWLADEAKALGLIDIVTTNPSGAQPAKEHAMALTKEDFAALCLSHSGHVALISKMDADGANKSLIESAISAIDTATKSADEAKAKALADADAKIAAAATKNAEEITAKNAELAKVAKERDDALATAAKLGALGGSAGKDPGSDHNSDGPKTAEEWGQAWDKMTKTERAAYLDDKELFVAEKTKSGVFAKS